MMQGCLRWVLMSLTLALVMPVGVQAAETGRYLYYINQGLPFTIMRAPLDNPAGIEVIITLGEGEQAHGISIDSETEVLVYTAIDMNTGLTTVRRADADGANGAVLYEGDGEGGPGYGGIVHIPDSIDSDIAWINGVFRLFHLGTADGDPMDTIDVGASTVIDPGGLGMTDLVIDPGSERALVPLFFQGAILEISPSTGIQVWMDETSNPSLAAPAAIDIDVDGEKVYWIQDGGSSLPESGVWRSDLSGANVEQLYAEVTALQYGGIAVDAAEGQVYWADHQPRRILRGPLDGSEEPEVFLLPFIGVRHIAIADFGADGVPEPGSVLATLAVLGVVGLLRTRSKCSVRSS